MAAVIRYIDNDGRTKVRDPNRVALVNRKGVAGVLVHQDHIDLSKLGQKDAGLVFFALSTDGLGGGEGEYLWDGQYARKLSQDGVSDVITCTSGDSIIGASLRQLVMGCNHLRLTAASGLTVGTATTKPILPDGYHGQRLTVTNTGATNSITLTDVAGMALSNLKLVGATQVLAAGKSLVLVFDSTLTAGQRWRQVTPLSS